MSDIHRKLARVRAGLPSLKKGGFNQRQEYTYIRKDDIFYRVRALLAEHEIGFSWTIAETASYLREDKKTTAVMLTVEFTFTALSDESTLVVRSLGEAHDTGDKAAGKALAYATKYMLINLLLIEGADPDPDESNPGTPPEGSGMRDALYTRLITTYPDMADIPLIKVLEAMLKHLNIKSWAVLDLSEDDAWDIIDRAVSAKRTPQPEPALEGPLPDTTPLSGLVWMAYLQELLEMKVVTSAGDAIDRLCAYVAEQIPDGVKTGKRGPNPWDAISAAHWTVGYAREHIFKSQPPSDEPELDDFLGERKPWKSERWHLINRAKKAYPTLDSVKAPELMKLFLGWLGVADWDLLDLDFEAAWAVVDAELAKKYQPPASPKSKKVKDTGDQKVIREYLEGFVLGGQTLVTPEGHSPVAVLFAKEIPDKQVVVLYRCLAVDSGQEMRISATEYRLVMSRVDFGTIFGAVPKEVLAVYDRTTDKQSLFVTHDPAGSGADAVFGWD